MSVLDAYPNSRATREFYNIAYHLAGIDEKMKELSKVKTGTIIGKRDDVLKVTFNGNGEIRAILNHFVPEAKIGDKVRVHYGYAVEKV